jgi:hypothetical protein
MCACSHHAKPGVTRTTPAGDRTPRSPWIAGLQEAGGPADTPRDRHSPWPKSPESGCNLRWRSSLDRVQQVEQTAPGRRLLVRLGLFAFCVGLLLLRSSRPAEAPARREPQLLGPVDTTLKATAREVDSCAGRAAGSGSSTVAGTVDAARQVVAPPPRPAPARPVLRSPRPSSGAPRRSPPRSAGSRPRPASSPHPPGRRPGRQGRRRAGRAGRPGRGGPVERVASPGRWAGWPGRWFPAGCCRCRGWSVPEPGRGPAPPPGSRPFRSQVRGHRVGSDLLALFAAGLLAAGALFVRATRPAAATEGGGNR